MIPANPVLILIDLQKAIDHPSWGQRNNPQAEANVARLLAKWRKTARPIIHVRHESREPDSTYRPGQPGADFKPEAQPLPHETVITKNVASAFIGTNLQAILEAEGWRKLVVVGVITNNSVESFVRMAGDLGYDTYLVSDATFTFGRADYNGKHHPAEDVHALALANMDKEYATIIDTETLLSW